MGYMRHGGWPKSCAECHSLRDAGAPFEPDPCANGCILQSFGADVLEAWAVWQLSTERWQDPKSKIWHYSIHWPALPVVFRAYGMDDWKRGLNLISEITHLMTGPPLMEDYILGITDEKT